MIFIKPSEFDFVTHWSIEDKKKVAGFLYKIGIKYLYIEPEEILSYGRYRVFLELQKNNKLLPNSNLLGRIRADLYCINKKYQKEVAFEIEAYEEISCDSLIDDIKKHCCNATGTAVYKKINGYKLSQYEYRLIKQNRDKIIEYINI
jgi:hypothetical protein